MSPHNNITNTSKCGEILTENRLQTGRKTYTTKAVKKGPHRASLVAQWLRICLLMQGTWVRALVWEDPTCRRATRPVSHNY